MLDVVEVGIGVGGVLVADDDFFAKREEKMAVSAAWALLFGTSAAIGFKRVHACRSLQRGLAAEPEERAAVPPALPEAHEQRGDSTGPVDGIASPPPLALRPGSLQR